MGAPSLKLCILTIPKYFEWPMPGITPQEKFLIFAAVLTMLAIGGVFVGAVLFFNRRLDNEQKAVEEIERDGGFERPDDE